LFLLLSSPLFFSSSFDAHSRSRIQLASALAPHNLRIKNIYYLFNSITFFWLATMKTFTSLAVFTALAARVAALTIDTP
jgi:hypothetical protein